MSLPSHDDPAGTLPVHRVSGSVRDAATELGRLWRDALQPCPSRHGRGRVWWKDPHYRPLISRIAPHLPDLFVGLAAGAQVDDAMLAEPPAFAAREGCTSFAMAAGRTRAGRPLAGQNKDTPLSRRSLYQIVAFEPTDAPGFLTLTYPGWLFGHGFVAGGCAIFRNQLYAGASRGLPYPLWGLLALHCPTVSDIAAFTCQWGIYEAAHVTILDTHGGILGIEATSGGIRTLEAREGIYAHANAVCADDDTARLDAGHAVFTRDESLTRQQRMYDLVGHRTDWTCPGLFEALSDHCNAPRSICRHEDPATAVTTTGVVADPIAGELWVSAGPPCTHRPTRYQLSRLSSNTDPHVAMEQATTC